MKIYLRDSSHRGEYLRMDGQLHNRIARKILSALSTFVREFDEVDTDVDWSGFGLSRSDFNYVVESLAGLNLVSRQEESCVATEAGLQIAKSRDRLDSPFPIDGDPDEPLPSEVELFGVRAFERARVVPPERVNACEPRTKRNL
jgi:hypothetical protein